MVLLLELFWKPQPPALIAVASILVLLAYLMDGWFFGYYNTKLRRRYALLFGCGAKALDDEAGLVAEHTCDAGVVHVRHQRSVSMAVDGELAAMPPGPAEPAAPRSAAAAGGGLGEGLGGSVWVVPLREGGAVSAPSGMPLVVD